MVLKKSHLCATIQFVFEHVNMGIDYQKWPSTALIVAKPYCNYIYIYIYTQIHVHYCCCYCCYVRGGRLLWRPAAALSAGGAGAPPAERGTGGGRERREGWRGTGDEGGMEGKREA